jgi:hypothetical protein
VAFLPANYRADHHRITGKPPENPPGAFKKSFLMGGYSFSGEKYLLQPFGGLFSGKKGRFFRQSGRKRLVQTES